MYRTFEFEFPISSIHKEIKTFASELFMDGWTQEQVSTYKNESNVGSNSTNATLFECTDPEVLFKTFGPGTSPSGKDYTCKYSMYSKNAWRCGPLQKVETK